MCRSKSKTSKGRHNLPAFFMRLGGAALYPKILEERNYSQSCENDKDEDKKSQRSCSLARWTSSAPPKCYFLSVTVLLGSGRRATLFLIARSSTAGLNLARQLTNGRGTLDVEISGPFFLRRSQLTSAQAPYRTTQEISRNRRAIPPPTARPSCFPRIQVRAFVYCETQLDQRRLR